MTDRRAITAGTAVGGAALLGASMLTNEAPLVDLRLGLVGAALGAIVPIDLHEHRIPNRIVLPAAVGTVPLLLIARGGSATTVLAIALVACMLLIALARPVALGMGDVKLALLLALGLGDHAPAALVAGMLLAAGYALVLLARHGDAARRVAMPLAPFLAAGALVGLLA